MIKSDSTNDLYSTLNRHGGSTTTITGTSSSDACVFREGPNTIGRLPEPLTLHTFNDAGLDVFLNVTPVSPQPPAQQAGEDRSRQQTRSYPTSPTSSRFSVEAPQPPARPSQAMYTSADGQDYVTVRSSNCGPQQPQPQQQPQVMGTTHIGTGRPSILPTITGPRMRNANTPRPSRLATVSAGGPKKEPKVWWKKNPKDGFGTLTIDYEDHKQYVLRIPVGGNEGGDGGLSARLPFLLATSAFMGGFFFLVCYLLVRMLQSRDPLSPSSK